MALYTKVKNGTTSQQFFNFRKRGKCILKRHRLKKFSNTKIIVNTIEELVTKEILSRRSLRGLPLQHQFEEALQFFVMLKKGKAMKVQFLRRKRTWWGFCRYGPPATCILLMTRRRGILDNDGRPSAISMTVAPRDQISIAVV